MPIVFPKRVPRTGEVMDVEGLDDALRPAVEVVSGLTEHNLSDDLASGLAVTDLDTDAAWRYLYLTASSSETALSASLPVDYMLRNTGGWQPVPGLTGAKAWRRSRVRCVANVQQSRSDLGSANSISVSGTKTSAGFFQIKYAVAVDGAIIPSTISGDVTPGQGEWMEVGRNGRATAEQLDVTIDIAPGYHEIGIYCYVDAPPVPQAVDVNFCVLDREVLYWELD